MTEFTRQDYLNRIGLDIQPALSAEGLKIIHQAQHRSIAFENFDVISGRGVELTAEKLINKLVYSQRGGYCFELNGLLKIALDDFGFDVRPLLGRVHISGEATGRSHFLLLVTIDGQKWIVDSGFGSQTPRAPVPLILNQEIRIDFQTFRLVEDELFGVMLQGKGADGWGNLYSFDFNHVCDGDIAYGNYYTSTHPDSVFRLSCIAALPTENGIVTLQDNVLRKRSGDKVIETELNRADYISGVKEHFNIELDTTRAALFPES